MLYKTKEVLDQIMRERDISQTVIARALAVSPQSVQQWCSGKTRPKGQNLEALARYLNLPPAILQFGPQAGREAKTTIHTEDGFVVIPRFSVRGACNPSGFVNPQDGAGRSIIDLVRTTYEWLRAKAPSAHFDHLEIITADGDSMEPTIKKLDFVFVDRTYRTVREEGVYAVTFADELFIKRIQKQVDGGLLLISDNPKYPSIHVSQDQLDRVIIEGKCMLNCSATEL